MRYRAMGVLFVLSGVFFVAGVLDPPILPTWGDSATDVMATASAHRAAWFASTWLITLSIVAGLAAVELLAPALDTDLARTGPVAVPGRQRARPRLNHLRPGRVQYTPRRPSPARLVLRHPALG